MTTERIDIIVTMQGDRVVKRNMDDIGNAAKKTTDSVQFLKRTLQTIGVGLLLRELKQYLDVNTEIANRLKLVTTNSAELVAVQDRLFKTAQATRNGYKETVQVYSRLSLSAKELGLSQNQLLRVTELLNKTVTLSGSNTSEASAAMLQFGQAMAAGVLRGDEFRSIMENLPGLAQQLAKGLGVSVGALRSLSMEGKLTSDVIIKALQKQGVEIDDLYSKTNSTISQALTTLDNALTRLIGNLDTATGLSGGIAKAILTIADNIDVLAKGVGVLAVAITARLIPSIVMATRALVVMSLSNPFTALLTGLGAALGAMVFFRDEVTEAAAFAANKFLDAFSFMKIGVKTFFKTLVVDIKIIFTEMINAVIDQIEMLLNTISAPLSKLPGVGDKFGQVALGRLDGGALLDQKAAIRAAAEREMSENVGVDRFDIKNYLKMKNAAKNGGSGGYNLDQAGVATPPGPNAADMKKAQREWEQLLAAIDPVRQAMADFTAGQQQLDQALASGRINLSEHARLTELLGAYYQDAVDPLGRVKKEILETTDAARGNTREQKIAQEYLKYENQLRREGIVLTQQQRAELEQLVKAQVEMQNPTPLEAYRRELENTGDTIQQALVNGIRDASDGLAKFFLEGMQDMSDFGDALKSLGQQFASLIIQKQLLGLVDSFGLGSFLSRNGNVFQDGRAVSFFRNGGVVNSPTSFPMSDGRVGMMAEDEPEAIMPLKRGKNGRLGVEVSGGGQQAGITNIFSPNINVSVPSATSPQDAERTGAEVSRQVQNAMAEFMRQQQRPGGQLAGGGTYN